MSPLRLWIGGYGPEETAHGKGLAAFRDMVEAETDGAVVVPVTWNIMDEGRPNTDLFELVQSGEMFFCYFSSSYLGHRVPALDVLEVPFLFDNLDHAHRLLDGPLGVRLAEAVRADTDFEVLGFWDNGFRQFTNRLRPVHRPDDCQGMRVRVQPNAIHEALIDAWGAVPVAVELSEGVRLITRGEVDAQENPLANTAAYGVDSVHQHVSMTGHLYGARGLWANRAKLEALPPDVGQVVRAAVVEAIAVQRREAAAKEVELRESMERAGLAFVDLDEEGRRAFLEASKPAIDYAEAALPRELLEIARS